MTTAPQIYDYAYYEKIYTLEAAHWWHHGMRDAMDAVLAPALAKTHTGQLSGLDAGCGTGYLLEYLRRYTVQEVVGFDISAHALAFCRQRGALRIALASAVEPPFADASFDLIACIDTIQHVSPIGADATTMQALARMLKPNGLLFIRTNSTLGHVRLEGADPNLYRRYSRRDLIQLARDAGLHVERASYVNLIPSVWAMMGEIVRALQQGSNQAKAIGPGLAMRRTPPPAINALMRAILQGEAALIRAGIDLPFGHSQILLARKK